MDYQNWRELVIDEWGAGQRIDVFLSRRFSKFSRSSIVRYIRSNDIVCVGRSIKPSSLLFLGDVLRIYIPGLAPPGPPPPIPDIVFEDTDILVVNKPSGMLVHPSGDTFTWTVITLCKMKYTEHCLDLAHRLDRETSGTLIITKNKKSNSFMKKQLEKRSMSKVYKAIVHGVPDWEEYDLNAPIMEHPDAELRLRRTIHPDGAPSRTTFRVLKRLEQYSLIECTLHTGRTHQIRVHLEHLGFPILGDKIYGQPDDTFLGYLRNGITDSLRAATQFPRHALHAFSVCFVHPNGVQKRVEAPLPSDMQAVIDGFEPSWPSLNHKNGSK